MAYRDFNGTITIDEAAANRDISKINQTIPLLKNAKSSLITLRNQAAATKGETGNALQEKSSELIRQIDSQIAHLEATASMIRRVVRHYQILDQKVKAHIQAMKKGK